MNTGGNGQEFENCHFAGDGWRLRLGLKGTEGCHEEYTTASGAVKDA